MKKLLLVLVLLTNSCFADALDDAKLAFEAKEKQGIESPIKVYIPSIAPSSLVLYRGNKFPKLKGKLIAGALKLTHINVVTINEDGKAIAEERLFSELGERIRDIEVSPHGKIFFITDNGNLYQLKN